MVLAVANENESGDPPPSKHRWVVVILGAVALFGGTTWAINIYRGRDSPSLSATALLVVMVCLASVLVLSCLNLLTKPKQSGWQSLSDALDSATFKAISVSLAIPLVLALVASNLKVLESIRTSQVQRAQKARDDAVQKVLGAWGELSSLAMKIAYYPNTGDKEPPKLADYRRQLRDTKSHIQQATAAVTGQFSLSTVGGELALSSNDFEAFAWFFELVLQASESTAWHLEHLPEGSAESMQKLQDQLKTIQDGVASLVEKTLLSVLTVASRTLDDRAFSGPATRADSKKGAPATRHTLLPLAGLWLESYQDYLRFDPSLSNITGDEARKKVETFKQGYAQLPDVPEPNAVDELWRNYLAVPPSGRVEANNVPYSESYLEHLAAWMDFVALVGTAPGLNLKPNDCITIAPPNVIGRNAVRLVPCAAPHDAEVYKTGMLVGARGDRYPGDDQVRSLASEICSDADFTNYQNTKTPPDAVENAFYYPQESEWALHKRQVTCLLNRKDMSPKLVGSRRRT